MSLRLVPTLEQSIKAVSQSLLFVAARLRQELTCTPEAPVPITAHRLPRTSTPSAGQKELWYIVPLNLSRPWKSGM